MDRAAAARIIQGAFRRHAPKPNEFVTQFPEYDFALTKPVVTSTIIAIQGLPFIDLSEEPMPKGVNELLGYTATGELPIIRKIRGRNAILGVNKTNTLNVKRWVFTINFKAPESKAYIVYSDNSRLQINTTGPYERVLRFLNNTYLPGVWGAPVNILKIDTKLYINRKINLADLGQEISRRVPFSKGSWSLEEELFSGGGFLRWKDPKATLIISTNGTVLTLGLKSFEDMGVTAKILEQLFSKYLIDKTKVFKYARGAWGLNYNRRPALPVPARKNLEGKRKQMAAVRNPLAEGWNNTREGFYVRPGANGKPRFYPLVANLKLVRPKVIRAYAEAGVPIPKGVRNVLGIEEGATPAPKATNRRAPGWNAVRNGQYVKPGPGGQPYFYKVPKNKKAAGKGVVEAYQKAGVKIPAHVRELFGLEGPNTPAAEAKKHYVNLNAQGGLRVNGKQYKRYTVAQLVAIARNLGLPQVSESMPLATIAEYIKMTLGQNKNVPNAELEGVPIIFMNNGRVKRGPRARQWATLKANEQNALAKAFLTNDEWSTYQPIVRKEKYQYILGMKRRRLEARAVSAQAAANEAAATAVSSANSNSNTNFARNIEFELMAQAALGNSARANDVAALKKILQNLPVGAKGRPLKPTVEKAIRDFKKIQGRSNQLANIRRKYEAAIQIPNWLPKNLHAGYKKALLNTATAVNTQGRLPTKEAVKRGIQGWLNAHLPQVARPSYTKENVVTGAVVKVPAWDPTRRKSPVLPNQSVKKLGPAKAPKAPKAPGPAVGPIKKAKKDPRENKEYALPRTNNAENIVNAIAALGLNIGPNSRYSWTALNRAGLNNRFYQNWMNLTASPEATTVNAAKAKLNSLKTAKARQQWLAARRNKFGRDNYSTLVAHRTALNQRNKNRRAAKRNLKG